MKLMNSWFFWVIVYLISAVIFAQTFKKANRKMKNAGSLTILLEMKFPPVESIIILGIVVIIYALTDRLNIEARYGLDPSVFSMLKQLSTVFLIILGFIFLNEEIVLKKIIGSIIIIFANVILTFESGKFKINDSYLSISYLIYQISYLQ